jgi:hypothetical protein
VVRARAPSAKGIAISLDIRWQENHRQVHVDSSPASVALLLVTDDIRDRVLALDAFERYQLEMKGGAVTALRAGLEDDPDRLVRGIRLVAALASRPAQLRERWQRLAKRLAASLDARRAWRLLRSSSISGTRHGVEFSLEARVATPGEPEPRDLYTILRVARRGDGPRFLLSARHCVSHAPAELRARFPRGLDLSKTPARFILGVPRGIELWAPGLILDGEAAEALVRAGTLLAAPAPVGPYR